MKPLIVSLSVIFAAIVLFAFANMAYAGPAANETTVETLENGDILYSHVTVLIEYGWTDPEKITNVSAVVHYEGEVAVAVVVTKKDKSKEEFFIRGGIVVKILNHKGELIKLVEETPRAT